MKTWQRFTVAIPAVLLCMAATHWAVRGGPDSNAGYLSTESAAVLGSVSSRFKSAVHGHNTGSGAQGFLGNGNFGVEGRSPNGTAVVGQGYQGVSGFATGEDEYSAGVSGLGRLLGVDGYADSNAATAVGVRGRSANGFGVRGNTTNGTGIYGVLAAGGTGHAGYFDGRVHVNGTLSKSAGAFKIDHPLDPAGKYLSHSFVESPDMKNIYDGVVTLGPDGSAIVELPEWFDALNTDFRYQLTCIGEHAPVYIAEKIQENRFRIAGGYADMEVSWQVTGTRNDPYAKVHRIPVEEAKRGHEVGRFLHPELYGQTVTQRIGAAVPR